MKKVILLALLSAAFCASAGDQYLYWMISDTATFNDGTKFPTAEGAGYSAKVGYIDGSGNSQYLSLYTTGGDLNSLGETLAISDINDNVPTFAKVLGGLGAETSFFIELLNDAHVVGSQNFTYADISPYLTAVDGMAVPAAGFLSAGSFTPVPEPTSGLLMLIGLAGLALRRKHKKA